MNIHATACGSVVQIFFRMMNGGSRFLGFDFLSNQQDLAVQLSKFHAMHKPARNQTRTKLLITYHSLTQIQYLFYSMWR
jgi:hypothetical protein